MKSLEKQVFRYSRSTTMTTDWGMVVIVLIIALGVWIIYGGDLVGGGVIVLIDCVFFGPLYINAKLVLSALCVDEDGITAIAFGRAWKSVKWRDVKEIRSYETTNFILRRSKLTNIALYSSNSRILFSKKGPIFFNNSIVEFDLLFDTIKKMSCKYGFGISGPASQKS